MRQSLLHRRQHVFARLGEHHAGGVQAGAGEAGSEQIRPFLHPQHGPLHPRQHAGEVLGGRGTMFGIRAGARDFVQRTQEKTAGGEGAVEGRDAEGDCPGGPGRVTVVPAAMGDPRDLVAQAGERFGAGGRQEHRVNIGPAPARVESEISAR